MSPAAHAQAAKAPATAKDVMIYQSIILSVFCRAHAEGVPFKKSLAIAIPSNVEVLIALHDGVVPIGDGKTKKLNPKQLGDGAMSQLMFGAESVCPKALPAEVKNEVIEFKKKANIKQ